ncbi:MAG: hypothetical protein HOV80_28855 [Polyangiaceae bacterium]|nr:hypothetical protein [Polyangiaceae bacterium]
MRSFLALTAACVAGIFAGAVGCTGDIGGSDEEPVPGPPKVEPKQVPAAPELITSTATCSALRPGEKLLSVSPEGHAWLVVEGSPNSVRVLDPFETSMVEVIEDVEIAGIVAGQAWSARDAAVVTDAGLWRLDDLARIELTPPSGFAAPGALCGDPGQNGLLVSNGKVFERRLDGQWWSWNPGVEGEGAPNAIVRYDGDCQSTANLSWLTSADGTLYRVEPATFSRPVRFEGFVGAAATNDSVAVLETDMLWMGPDAWQSWIFPGPVPTELSASAGLYWMVSGSQLLRFDGETFNEVTHGITGPIERVAAHAGGAWVVGGDKICHQATGPMVRIEGVRPFSRTTEIEIPIRVRASDASDVTATIDGTPITLVSDDEGWLAGEARLDTVGWHTIDLAAAGGGAARSVVVKRLPEVTRSWEADIAPIYQASCTNSDCHRAGSSDPPDLGSYDAWKEHSVAIRTRVLEAKTMPPAANIGPEWGDDDIETIREWLEGGMLP